MEVKFAASVIEQLDFALDHILLDDPNYKRLSLMLIDNALELALHHHALDRKGDLRWKKDEPKGDVALIDAATGQRFDSKLKLAKHTGWLSEDTARSVTILHGYRNQVYHSGLMHEGILHELAVFYLRTVVDLMATMPFMGYGYGNKLKLPHRAAKYIGMPPFRDIHALVAGAWARLGEISRGLQFDLAAKLRNDLQTRIAEVDRLLDYIARAEVPNKPVKPRRDVILESQAWQIVFTEEGKDFLRANPPAMPTVGGVVDHIAKSYRFAVRSDPVPSWTKRATSVGAEKNLHICLHKYQQLLAQIEPVQEAVGDSAAAVDQEVERQIERMRSNR
jgi:hypothetical protein